MRKTTLFFAALGLGLTSMSAASAEPKSYNGTWSVRLVTEAGGCDSSYSTTVAIADGQVRAVSGGASVSGGIGRDGSVALGIQQSIARGDASGRLADRSGSGTWRVAMLGCTGRWTAQRLTLTADNR
ncbi:MAG TPA: hypothetical protein VHL98_10615 [Microvirga sp.]|jgi:hypothetical protein|nr:hypothetical protein [Microvirga sp.]